MNVLDAVTVIKRDFGDEYGIIINNADIYAWIYAAELDIIRNTGTHEDTVTVGQGSFPYAVPDNVNIKRISVDGRALIPITREELDLIGTADNLSGGPTYWFKANGQINLWPYESSSQNLKITYSKTPTLFTGDPEDNTFTVPDAYHDDIITFVLARAFRKKHDLQMERTMMDTYDRNLPLRRTEEAVPDAPIYKGDDPMDYNEFDYM